MQGSLNYNAVAAKVSEVLLAVCSVFLYANADG
jgi:hypothetical protein